MSYQFNDRIEAGRLLARNLLAYSGRSDAVVLALPRGGVLVAFEVATTLGLPLDVFVVRKLGAPFRPDLIVGAIAPGGVIILDEPLIERLGISTHELIDEANAERLKLERRERAYRGKSPQQDLEGKLVILVDDGLASGATMKAAIAGARRLGAQQVVVAVPVAPERTCRQIEKVADELVCLHSPDLFHSIGDCYADFSLLTEEDVQQMLAEAPAYMGGCAHACAVGG
jgi:putative phosphoribosyl transferase